MIYKQYFIDFTRIPIPIPAISPVINLNLLLLFLMPINCVVPSSNIGVIRDSPIIINSTLYLIGIK